LTPPPPPADPNNPNNPNNPNQPVYSSLNDLVQHNRLQGYDLATGKLLWEQGGRGKGELEDSHFLGTPLVLQEQLYTLVEKEGNLRLLCLDPAKGNILWSMHLASFRTRLPQDPLRRLQNAQIVHADGILVCPTNAGVLLAVDLASRTVVWAHSYREGDPDSLPAPGVKPPAPRRPPGAGGAAPFVGFGW